MFYLYAARAARGLGDGFAAIILPTYLSEFGFSNATLAISTTRCRAFFGRKSAHFSENCGKAARGRLMSVYTGDGAGCCNEPPPQ
jgi:hypothetical protein